MIGAQEANVQRFDINDVLNADVNRPGKHEPLPSWMSRDAHVRFGETDVRLDEASLPRLDGIMGAVHMMRKGQVEPETPHVQVQYSPSLDTANRQSPFGMLLAFGPEIAALTAGAAAFLFSRNGKRLRNASLAFGNVEMAGRILSACGGEGQQPPPAITAEVPATAKPIETSAPSLGNEVLTGTPSAAPETLAPVGSVYPTEVTGMVDPKVYSYGGVEGRANMNEYTRALFDRYIAEMGRGGFVTGVTVEELYQSFDNGYDFKLYTTDAGLAWLVQSKADGSFLVPKNQDGELFRDLQLSYDYMFQGGAAVPVGIDNFDLQKFSANRVGFVGAWPVLVSVDVQNVPVSWVNMEQGGATAPIVMASVTSTPETAPTAIPDSRVELVVGAETFRVTTDVLYSEAVTNVNIDPSKVQKIGDLLVYADSFGRLIWNENNAAWTPEFTASMDFAHPELAPSVPFEAYYDGSKPGDTVYIPSSVALSDQLYVTEHPNLIAADASYPRYRVTLAWSDTTVVGYEITLRGPNSYLLPPDEVTQINRQVNKPFAYFGVQQTQDPSGDTIYVIKKANANPGGEISVLATNQGFDKAIYDLLITYPRFSNEITNKPSMTHELNPMFPYDFGTYRFNKNTFYADTQGANTNVAETLNTGMISMFDATTQQEIKDLYNGVGIQFDVNTNPMSFGLDSLPSDLTNMILYTTFVQFR